MKKNKDMKLFSILPYRLGGLDMMIPLYLKLKELYPNLKIEIAFNDDKAYQDHFRDDFLRPEVKNWTDKVHNLKPQMGGKIRNRFFSFLNALPLFAQILSARNPVLIHCGLEESPLIKWLSKAVRIRKGRIFTHFGSYNINIGVSPIDRVFGKVPDMDAFLYFGESDPAYLKNRQFPKLIQMGYPRLFSSWKEQVLNKSPELVKGELKKNNFSSDSRLVTVLLPSTIESLFSSRELKIWLKSVLRILRNEVPKDVIFLKPHPLQEMEIGEQVVDEIEDKNVKISFMHAGILSASSQFVISHHSTTIVDSMGLLIPTIHYQQFTAHWLQRHPDGSFCLKLNPLWARDEDELRKCIATALSKNYHVPKIEKILGHKDDVPMFFN